MATTTISLDQISIASPCEEPWDNMAGDSRVRFCGRCRLNVYNFESMTRTEAEALIERTEGRLCARFHRREDGTILTQDCPVGLRRVRAQLARAKAIGGALLALLFGALPFAGIGRGDSSRLASQQPFSTIREKILGRPPAPAKSPNINFVAGSSCAPMPPNRTPPCTTPNLGPTQ